MYVTLTGFAAGNDWVTKRVKENFTSDCSSSVMNYAKFTAVMAGSIALKKYLENQKIILDNVWHPPQGANQCTAAPAVSFWKKKLCVIAMARIVIMVDDAMLNAITFMGSNYLTCTLSGDDKAAQEENFSTTKPLMLTKPLMPNTCTTASHFWTGLQQKQKWKSRPSKTSPTPTLHSNSTIRCTLVNIDPSQRAGRAAETRITRVCGGGYACSWLHQLSIFVRVPERSCRC